MNQTAPFTRKHGCYCCEEARGNSPDPYYHATCLRHALAISSQLVLALVRAHHAFRLLTIRPDRVIGCAWCWKEAGLADVFPRQWSSRICRQHARMMRRQSAARRMRAQHIQPTFRSQEVQG